MNKTTLVIMAAGIGSRYGGGIKQLEKVGPAGEIIMDYSIYDALEAGFDKVIFIIRRDIEKEFKEIIGNRIERQVEVGYVYQELENLPTGYQVPEGRIKPWGTGHAILCCSSLIKEPFAVINADDYYGKEAFLKVHDYLSKISNDKGDYSFCMAGFILGNTLSEHGNVTRGVCRVDEQGMLSHIEEIFAIHREGETATAKDGQGNMLQLSLNTPVSMNLWGFTPGFIKELENGFKQFLDNLQNAQDKAEFLLPNVVGSLLADGSASVKVLETLDKWFGVTYKEDKDAVVYAIDKLTKAGKYPVGLFLD